MDYHYYSSDPLEFSYTDEELESVIDDYLQEIGKVSFSFSNLCDSVMYTAKYAEKIKSAPNTVYFSMDLSEKEYERISLVLWKKILANKLILNFHKASPNSNDYYFRQI
jgi:hypothetical protein